VGGVVLGRWDLGANRQQTTAILALCPSQRRRAAAIACYRTAVFFWRTLRCATQPSSLQAVPVCRALSASACFCAAVPLPLPPLNIPYHQHGIEQRYLRVKIMALSPAERTTTGFWWFRAAYARCAGQRTRHLLRAGAYRAASGEERKKKKGRRKTPATLCYGTDAVARMGRTPFHHHFLAAMTHLCATSRRCAASTLWCCCRDAGTKRRRKRGCAENRANDWACLAPAREKRKLFFRVWLYAKRRVWFRWHRMDDHRAMRGWLGRLLVPPQTCFVLLGRGYHHGTVCSVHNDDAELPALFVS